MSRVVNINQDCLPNHESIQRLPRESLKSLKSLNKEVSASYLTNFDLAE